MDVAQRLYPLVRGRDVTPALTLRAQPGFRRYFTRKQGREVVETGPFYSIRTAHFRRHR